MISVELGCHSYDTPDQVLAMVVAQLLGAFSAALIATVSTLGKRSGVEVRGVFEALRS